MEPSQWQRIKAAFVHGLSLDEEARGAWLSELAETDPELSAEVGRLIAFDGAAGSLFETKTAVADLLDDQPQQGDQVGPFEIVNLIGEGGMGRVYCAKQSSPIARTVALKIIKPGYVSKEVLGRFQQECRAIALMNHPNIARILEAGSTTDGRPYFAMEYVDGAPLDQAVESLNLRRKLSLFLQICRGVGYAHRQGIIHRDLNPGNILVGTEDPPQAKIIDFGIAKAYRRPLFEDALKTRAGELVGTPATMSPEQVAGDPSIDTRTDIYGLGVILYSLLCNRLPFDPEHPVHTLLNQINLGQWQMPSSRLQDLGKLQQARQVSGDLDWITAKAMALAPENRYQTVDQLAADVNRYLTYRPVVAAPPRLSYRIRKFVHRYRRQLSIAVVVGLALLTGSTMAVNGYLDQVQAKQRLSNYRLLAREVEQLDSLMTTSYLLPRHPLEKKQSLVRERIAAWMTQLEEKPEDAATMHYALGRAHLSLGETAAAIEHLQQAQDMGFQDGMLAYSLGKAYGQRYVEKRRELEILPLTRRQNLAEQLRVELLTKALAYLNQVDGSFTPSNVYLKALRLFYRGQREESLALITSFLSDLPVDYEGRLLEGNINLELAQNATDRGDQTQAETHLEAALRSFSIATLIARSNPRGYLGQAESLARLIVVDRSGRRETIDHDQEKALREISHAREIMPWNGRTWYLEALVNMRYGRHQARTGEDPADALERALHAAETFSAIDPGHYLIHHIRGAAHMYQAIYANRRGKDTKPGIEGAIASFHDAIRVAPEYAPSYQALAEVLVFRSHIQRQTGQDPSASIEKALSALNQAAEKDPAMAELWDTLGTTYHQLARHLDNKGGDPFPVFAQAVEAGQRALSLKKDPIFHYNKGLFHLGHAFAALKRQQPWETALLASIEDLSQAVTLSPKYGKAHGQLGLAWMTYAQEKIRAGEDPGEAIEAGSAAYQQAVALNPKDALAYINSARFHMLLGRNAEAPHHQQYFGRAGELLEQALTLNPKHAYGLYIHAIWYLENNREREGLDSLKQAISLNPSYREKAAKDNLFSSVHQTKAFRLLIEEAP